MKTEIKKFKKTTPKRKARLLREKRKKEEREKAKKVKTSTIFSWLGDAPAQYAMPSQVVWGTNHYATFTNETPDSIPY
jgi:hypothetical protein